MLSILPSVRVGFAQRTDATEDVFRAIFPDQSDVTNLRLMGAMGEFTVFVSPSYDAGKIYRQDQAVSVDISPEAQRDDPIVRELAERLPEFNTHQGKTPARGGGASATAPSRIVTENGAEIAHEVDAATYYDSYKRARAGMGSLGQGVGLRTGQEFEAMNNAHFFLSPDHTKGCIKRDRVLKSLFNSEGGMPAQERTSKYEVASLIELGMRWGIRETDCFEGLEKYYGKYAFKRVAACRHEDIRSLTINWDWDYKGWQARGASSSAARAAGLPPDGKPDHVFLVLDEKNLLPSADSNKIDSLSECERKQKEALRIIEAFYKRADELALGVLTADKAGLTNAVKDPMVGRYPDIALAVLGGVSRSKNADDPILQSLVEHNQVRDSPRVAGYVLAGVARNRKASDETLQLVIAHPRVTVGHLIEIAKRNDVSPVTLADIAAHRLLTASDDSVESRDFAAESRRVIGLGAEVRQVAEARVAVAQNRNTSYETLCNLKNIRGRVRGVVKQQKNESKDHLKKRELFRKALSLTWNSAKLKPLEDRERIKKDYFNLGVGRMREVMKKAAKTSYAQDNGGQDSQRRAG
jgi:hypothetical protein